MPRTRQVRVGRAHASSPLNPTNSTPQESAEHKKSRSSRLSKNFEASPDEFGFASSIPAVLSQANEEKTSSTPILVKPVARSRGLAAKLKERKASKAAKEESTTGAVSEAEDEKELGQKVDDANKENISESPKTASKGGRAKPFRPAFDKDAAAKELERQRKYFASIDNISLNESSGYLEI
eukprot:Clim_evm4s66 gene=Clim_evmTU4s66